MDYKKSSLWRNSIGNDSLCEKALREKLQYEYELARNNSAYLLDKIRKDFPQLTIHDITHVDNLSLQEGDGKDGYSILDYINFVAKDIGVVVHKKTEENRINTIWGEACSVLKLGFATL